MTLRLLVAVAGIGAAMLAPARAEIYRNFKPDAPVEAAGGQDRDIFEVRIDRRAFPSGTVAIELAPATATATTVMAYDPRLREVARASSENGRPVTLTFTAEHDGVFYVRVVPTGGAFDTPPGTKFRRSALPAFTNRAMLGGYRLVARDGSVAETGPVQTATVRPSPAPARASAPTASPVSQPAAALGTAVRAAPAPAISLDPKLLAKRFGSLASLVGTSWTIGKDTVNEISWDRPGEGILIRWRGIWGDRERLVAPTADGKSLRYIQRDNDYGFVDEAVVPIPGGGRFLLEAMPNDRAECAIRKDRIECTNLATDAKKKWQRTSTYVAAKSTPARDAALLAALPGSFPMRGVGRYHPTLGVLAEMAAQRWTWVQTSAPLKPGYYSPQLLEIYESDNSLSLMLTEGNNVIPLQGSRTRLLTAKVADPVNADPGRTLGYTLKVWPGGATGLCTFQTYKPYAEQCRMWRLSKDGTLALVTDHAGNRAFWRAIPPLPADTAAVFRKLDGRYFRTPGGFVRSFTTSREVIVMASYGSHGSPYHCQLQPSASSAICGTEKPQRLIVQPASFSIGNTTYLPGDKSLTVQKPDGKTEMWTELSRSSAELGWQEARVAAEYRSALRQYRIDMRAQRAEEQRIAERWQQTFRAIAGGAYNSPLLQPSTPADWSARLSSGSASLPGMGGSYHVAAPMMTPQQQAQWDEVERYKIRQQIYGQSQGGYSGAEHQQQRADRARAAAAADRRAAEAETRQRQLRANDAVVQDAQTKAYEAQLRTANGGAGSSASTTPGAAKPAAATGKATTPGIIVRDGSAEQRAWEKAEAERVRANAAAAQAQAQRDAEAKRLDDESRARGDEINRVSEELRRRVEQCKQGGCPSDKSSKVKPE